MERPRLAPPDIAHVPAQNDPADGPMLTLRVRVHSDQAEVGDLPDHHVLVRQMGSPNAERRELRHDGRGLWTIELPHGEYLIELTGRRIRPEYKPIVLRSTGAPIDLFAASSGGRVKRVLGQRIPCDIPGHELVAFIEPGSDAMAVARVIAATASLGLRVDSSAAAPGVRRLARWMECDLRSTSRRAMPWWLVDRLILLLHCLLAMLIRRLIHWLGARGHTLPAEVTRRVGTLGDGSSVVLPVKARDVEHARAAVGKLRRLPGVCAAGISLRPRGGPAAVRRPILDVHSLTGHHPSDVMTHLEVGAGTLRIASFGDSQKHPIPGFFQIAATDEFDEDLEDIADQLLGTGLILSAEPQIAENGSLTAGDSGDWATPLQWDMKRINLPEAHNEIRPRCEPGWQTKVAIIDDGIEHFIIQRGDERHFHVPHADLDGRITLMSGEGVPGGHLTTQQGHGQMVASLIAAADNTPDQTGLIGVAPQAQVTAFHLQASVYDTSLTFRHASGLIDGTGGYSDVIVHAANSSQDGSPPSNVVENVSPPHRWTVFSSINQRGRRGRGAVIVLSAGNDNATLAASNPQAMSRDVLTVGASDVVSDGRSGSFDRVHDDSCHGEGLDCVAPGYRGGKEVTLTGRWGAYAQWPAAPLDLGQVARVDGSQVMVEVGLSHEQIPRKARMVLSPASESLEMWLVNSASSSRISGQVQLELDHDPPPVGSQIGLCDRLIAYADKIDGTSGRCYINLRSQREDLAVGDVVLLIQVPRTDTDPKRDALLYVKSVNETTHGQTQIEVVVKAGHSVGDAVRGIAKGEIWRSSPAIHRNFGQTSAASALCGGLAALVISACPELTSIEVRDIICSTAKKIAPKGGSEADIVADGELPHPHMGWGQIDALLAVRAALGYDHPRDLYFATELPPGELSPECNEVWSAPASRGWETPRFLGVGEGAADHEPLPFGGSGYVFAIVRNKSHGGDPKPSLQAWVRFYAIMADANDDFTWPDHWAGHTAPPSGQSMVEEKSYFIGEVPLPPGLEDGRAIGVQVRWPTWASPVAGGEIPRHVLVEVVPHDGRHVTADTYHISTNNNLARRLMMFEAPGGPP